MPETNLTEARNQAIRDHYLRLRDYRYDTAPGQARNVIGIAIGPRIRGGALTEEQCIRFFVERKIPRSAVQQGFRIPPELQGVPTDVIETRRFTAYDYTAAPGSDIGVVYDAPNVPASLGGTLGGIVKVGNFWYALGSNHVMAVNGRVPVRQRILFKPPQRFIVNPDDNFFARLAVWVPLRPEGPDYDPGNPNQVDCALARVEKPDRVTGRFPGRIAVSDDFADPEPGDPVFRVDEREEATGFVEQVGMRVRIDYRFGTFDFEDMVLIKGTGGAFANPGDSGALVIGTEGERIGKPVAMIVGGSQNYAIACKLTNVRSALKKELCSALPRDYRAEDGLHLVSQAEG